MRHPVPLSVCDEAIEAAAEAADALLRWGEAEVEQTKGERGDARVKEAIERASEDARVKVEIVGYLVLAESALYRREHRSALDYYVLARDRAEGVQSEGLIARLERVCAQVREPVPVDFNADWKTVQIDVKVGLRVDDRALDCAAVHHRRPRHAQAPRHDSAGLKAIWTGTRVRHGVHGRSPTEGPEGAIGLAGPEAR